MNKKRSVAYIFILFAILGSSYIFISNSNITSFVALQNNLNNSGLLGRIIIFLIGFIGVLVVLKFGAGVNKEVRVGNKIRKGEKILAKDIREAIEKAGELLKK